MDAKQEPPIKRSVEDVFRDFQGRRKGLIKALTTDFNEFYQKCDPEMDNLCLYGIPNGSWEVNVPVEEVPPELPEPIVGINFAKEGMPASEWLSLVAMHSDSWLLSVAFYFGARFMFDKNQRKMLFEKINELPNVFEVVTTQHPEQLPTSQSNAFENFTAEQLATSQSKGKETVPSEKMVEVSRNEYKIKLSGKMPQSRTFAPQPKRVMSPTTEEDSDSDEEEEEGEEEADEQGTNCGACGDDGDVDGFWICCDVCERWFHGQCVKITPAKAEHIKHYKCPDCGNRKARLH